ncbi:MAG TPA: hypothetical protein VLH56_18940 [Dissulfurispiraceae bacterium]|nr:hypothetical protein [Dissulfurispiraceae bacterium]
MPRLIDDALNRFPTYASAADYKARTGWLCPEFDPASPEKNWEDVEGGQTTEDMVVYTRIPVSLTPTGPVYKTRFLTPTQAGRVNLRPAGHTIDTGLAPIQCPHRELRDDEVVLRKKDSLILIFEVWTSVELEARPKSDRDILVAIAKKLGVQGV